MAFTGIGKLIKDLVTDTPADTDYFAFGNTDLKKVSFPNLKKALGIDALNSAFDEKLKFFKSYSVFDTNSNNTDENYQYALKYFLQESSTVGNGIFAFNMNLKYGSAYIAFGYKSDSNNITGIIMSHNRDNPIYFCCRQGSWTFK